MEQAEKKVRKTRADKGIPRTQRTALAFAHAPEPEAPIHVRIKLKGNADTIEFGCEERTVENGFHVFTYPAERNRFCTTRREFAISEIVEIEITAARGQVQIMAPATPERYEPPPTFSLPPVTTGPKIHSARKAAVSTLEQLETSNGPIKMDTMPIISFGDHAG